MKKVFSLMLVVVLALSAYAKKGDVTEINRDCTLSGGVFALCKSETVSQKDAIMVPEGSKWFIENKRIGKNNYVSFWIETPEGEKKELNYWKEHEVAAYIIKNDNGTTAYAIRDDMFSYLTMIEVKKGVYIIQLFTKEL